MRFIHLSDLHLGRPLNAQKFFTQEDHQKRLFEKEEAFYQLLKKTPKDVDFYLLTGDVFDQDGLPSYLLKRFIKETQNAPVPIVMIAGNHDDFLESPHWYEQLTGGQLTLLHADAPSVLIKDVQIDGQSTKDFAIKTLEKIPFNKKAKYRILALHGDVTNPQDRYYLTDLASLKKLPYDYIGLGHIHHQQFLTPEIAYAGNLEPLDISETGPKGYILGDLKKASYQFVPQSTRTYQHLHIVTDATDDHSAIVEKIKALKVDAKTMVRIYLSGEKPTDNEPLERLYAFLKPLFFSVDIQDQRTFKKDIKRLKKEYPGSLVDVLIDEADDDETLGLALEALFAKGGAR